MAEITVREATGQILAVLREGFEGAQQGWSYFIDHGSDAGLFQFLPKLSADEASRPWGGSSIAAHVYHLIFSLEASTASVSGDQTRRDWKQSWRVSTVDPQTWERMQEELRAGYEILRQAIEEHAVESTESMGEAVAAVAHVGYHLGALRQKLALGHGSTTSQRT